MTEIKFQELYTNYIESGLSIKEYCHHMGYHKSSFYGWLKKWSTITHSIIHSNQSNHPPLSPIILASDTPISTLPCPIEHSSSRASATKIEITHPSGLTIKITGSIEPSLLTTILNQF